LLKYVFGIFACGAKFPKFNIFVEKENNMQNEINIVLHITKSSYFHLKQKPEKMSYNPGKIFSN